MNAVDLRACLDSWPYNAEKNVRIGRGADGREIILVRQPMGLEQYEADGHPGGTSVPGRENLLDVHRARIHAADPTLAAAVFELTARDCVEIFQEASAFYTASHHNL